MQAKAVMIMTTVDSDDLAAAIATALLEQRLAACVQQVRIGSRYRWQGKLQNDDEILLLVKTSMETSNAAMRCIELNHSYDVPEIIAVPVTDGFPAYLEWLKRESGPE